MNYSEFLFCHLIRDYSIKFMEMPIDDMWDNYGEYYTKYLDSKYNVDTKSEIECMTDFIITEMN